MRMTNELASWQEGEYVADWVGEDVLSDLLSLPRKISAALVEACGIGVDHVVDLGSGHGPYLELLLDAFPGARGTWVDSSPAMEPLARENLGRFEDRVAYVLGDVEQLARDPSLLARIDPRRVSIRARSPDARGLVLQPGPLRDAVRLEAALPRDSRPFHRPSQGAAPAASRAVRADDTRGADRVAA